MKISPKKKPAKRNRKPVAVPVSHGKGDVKQKQADTKIRKGGRTCLVCAHPERPDIDRGLVNGSFKPADVARKVGCSRVSVGRHFKNHLIPDVKTSLNTSSMVEGGTVDLGTEIRAMYSKVKDILTTVEGEKNWKAIKAFHGEIRGYLELLGKLMGKIESGTTVNVIVSPVWVQMRTVMIQALEPYPEARIALAKALTEIDGGTVTHVAP